MSSASLYLMILFFWWIRACPFPEWSPCWAARWAWICTQTAIKALIYYVYGSIDNSWPRRERKKEENIGNPKEELKKKGKTIFQWLFWEMLNVFFRGMAYCTWNNDVVYNLDYKTNKSCVCWIIVGKNGKYIQRMGGKWILWWSENPLSKSKNYI